MPFAVGEKQGTAPSEAAAVTPEPSGQGRTETGAQTPVQQQAQVPTEAAVCFRPLSHHFATCQHVDRGMACVGTRSQQCAVRRSSENTLVCIC